MSLKISKTFWLSLGENCLSDSILERHGLRTFSTVYSNGRSNIDYALFLEKNNYQKLLKTENLKYDFFKGVKVVRSTSVVDCDPIFLDLQMNGFEFTHHDVIGNKKHIESCRRKIERQLKFRKKRNFIFLYHHRLNETSDFNLLFKKLYEFSKFYSTKTYFCKMIIFSQNIVKDNSERNISYKKINDSVHFFNLATLKIWDGDTDDFWAKNDTDLIQQLIEQSQFLSKQKSK
ncbi:MAG: DUF1796 family putative cysteine peptidase [Lutibacter sp.]